MNTQFNLFPETLLVEVVDGRPVTTSLKVAKYFGRQHKNVLKIISRILDKTSSEKRRLNFEPRLDAYKVNNANRKRQFYLLTEEAFSLVTMSFTGEKALEWKWRFLESYMFMRSQLAEREARYARALDVVRPYLRPVAEATERGESRIIIGERLEKSANAVTYHRRRARELGILERKAA